MSSTRIISGVLICLAALVGGAAIALALGGFGICASEVRTQLINRERVRWLGAGGWQGASKEHRQPCSVTEEQRRQTRVPSQPEGLPVFGAAALLFVGRRSWQIFFLLAPRRRPNSLATHLLPIYELGSGLSLVMGAVVVGAVLSGSLAFLWRKAWWVGARFRFLPAI